MLSQIAGNAAKTLNLHWQPGDATKTDKCLKVSPEAAGQRMRYVCIELDEDKIACEEIGVNRQDRMMTVQGQKSDEQSGYKPISKVS